MIAMKNKKISGLIFLGVLVCVAIPALGQAGKLDLKNLEKLSAKATNVTDVSLDASMLQLAAQSMGKDKEEAQTRDLIKNLKGVYVKVFEFDKENQYSPEDVEGIRAQLQGPNWTRAVNVREEKTHETTEVYLMKEGESIIGLTVLAAEPKELTVVNVIGPIDFQKLGALGALGNLGIPQLQTRPKPKKATSPANKPAATPEPTKPSTPPPGTK
jgi:uncharacterized protein DUF4252